MYSFLDFEILTMLGCGETSLKRSGLKKDLLAFAFQYFLFTIIFYPHGQKVLSRRMVFKTYFFFFHFKK